MNSHEGLNPLSDEDMDALRKLILKRMSRLKIGKSVSIRQQMISKTLLKMDLSDRYWIESLASKLTEENVQSADAQAISFTCAAEIRESEVSKMFLQVNGQNNREYSGKVLRGLIAAAPEIEERIMNLRIDSDQILMRTVLAYAFRRDSENVFHMFVVDASARKIDRIWKGGIQGFVKWGIQRPDEHPAPEGAVGYMVVLARLNMKGGFYLYPPTPASRSTLKGMQDAIRESTYFETQESIDHAVAAAAFSNFFLKGELDVYCTLMGALSEHMGIPYFIMHASDDEGGVRTRITPFAANSIEEARRIIMEMPEVRIHDDVRALSERLGQIIDVKNVGKLI